MHPAEVTFLIIDDNDVSRSMMRHVLNTHKFKVVGEAASAQVGLELFEKLEPSVVCLDIGLPDRSGLEVLKRTKELAPATEVLMVTGNNDRNSVMEAVQGGAAGYIVKPFNAATLLRTVEQAAAKVVGSLPTAPVAKAVDKLE